MPSRAKVKTREKTSPAFARMLEAQKQLAGGLYLKVGFLDDGSREPDSDITLAALAAVHEYGYPEGKIPARPFVGPSWDENRAKYERTAAKLLRRFSGGNLDLESALGVLGAVIATDMRDYVVKGAPIAPENAPSVKARKEARARRRAPDEGPGLGVRTLVDTGRMMASITWVVVRTRPPAAK